MRRLALLFSVAACTGGDDGDKDDRPPPPPMPAYLIDAAPSVDAPPVATVIPHFDPASGYHLDEDVGGGAARRSERTTPRERRWLSLTLKSSPSGAIAAVDGKVVGRTPVYWEGEFTGREREFTFVLPGYSMARYRFVPTHDGVVHGRLVKVANDGDAGVPEIPLPEPEAPPPTVRSAPPRRPPTTPVPAPAPPRPVTPDAAPAAAP